MAKIKDQYQCPLTMAMDLIGGKWKMLILWQLRNDLMRFSQLRRQLSGITQKMLTQELRELEGAGLINRTVYPVVPPKVEYALSVEGQSLMPVLAELCQWSKNYADQHSISYAQGGEASVCCGQSSEEA